MSDAEVAAPGEEGQESPSGKPAEPAPSESGGADFADFIKNSSEAAIVESLKDEIKSLTDPFKAELTGYALFALYDRKGEIGRWEADRIMDALEDLNADREKDIFLFLLSRGGSVEPAYQISTLCREYRAAKFVISVPREAKSAATLICLGADEIHMGPLGELGPIDPQVRGLPALAVTHALKTVSEIASEYPKSGEMWASFLKQSVSIEQIGYSERIAKSAAQYAGLLLGGRTLPSPATEIADLLVYKYMDHGFAINRAEARKMLGAEMVPEKPRFGKLSDGLYKLFTTYDALLMATKRQQLQVVGSLLDGVWVWDLRD